jgi:hypothetical protein
LPTTLEDAERLLAAATTPEQAWAIYELAADRAGKWRAVRLRAEAEFENDNDDVGE